MLFRGLVNNETTQPVRNVQADNRATAASVLLTKVDRMITIPVIVYN